jgi:hypothetical protein
MTQYASAHVVGFKLDPTVATCDLEPRHVDLAQHIYLNFDQHMLISTICLHKRRATCATRDSPCCLDKQIRAEREGRHSCPSQVFFSHDQATFVATCVRTLYIAISYETHTGGAEHGVLSCLRAGWYKP